MKKKLWIISYSLIVLTQHLYSAEGQLIADRGRSDDEKQTLFDTNRRSLRHEDNNSDNIEFYPIEQENNCHAEQIQQYPCYPQ